MFDDFMGTVYMKSGLYVAMTGKPMDPSKYRYCSSVSRCDIETVAAAIAKTHECDF